MRYSNNVLMFPEDRMKKDSSPQTIEDVEEKVDDFKRIHIQESLETLVPLLFNQIHMLGFEPPEDESLYIKEGSLVVEAIRSFMSKVHDIPHPLHMIAEHMFEDHGEEGLVMSDRVKIVITTKEED